MRRVVARRRRARARAPAVRRPHARARRGRGRRRLRLGRATGRARGSRRHARVDGFAAACARVLEVARGGGGSRSRPRARRRCSPLYRAARRAMRASARGRRRARARDETGARSGRRGRRGCWWVDSVAVAHRRARASSPTTAPPRPREELLFTLARPDLVVADRRTPASRSRPGSRWWRSPTSTRSRSPSPPGRAGRSASCPSTSADRPGLPPLVDRARGCLAEPAPRRSRSRLPRSTTVNRRSRRAPPATGPLWPRSSLFCNTGRTGLRSPRGEAGETEGVSQWRSHSPRRGS